MSSLRRAFALNARLRIPYLHLIPRRAREREKERDYAFMHHIFYDELYYFPDNTAGVVVEGEKGTPSSLTP